MSELNIEAKKIADAEVKAIKQYRRKKKRLQRKCFWTKPLGHFYERDDSSLSWNTFRCVGCNKEKIDYGPYG